jgi:hypothetical protein
LGAPSLYFESWPITEFGWAMLRAVLKDRTISEVPEFLSALKTLVGHEGLLTGWLEALALPHPAECRWPIPDFDLADVESLRHGGELLLCRLHLPLVSVAIFSGMVLKDTGCLRK